MLAERARPRLARAAKKNLLRGLRFQREIFQPQARATFTNPLPRVYGTPRRKRAACNETSQFRIERLRRIIACFNVRRRMYETDPADQYLPRIDGMAFVQKRPDKALSLSELSSVNTTVHVGSRKDFSSGILDLLFLTRVADSQD